jgi:adenylate cyclase class IV
MTEIEIRGQISKIDFVRLMKLLDENGKLVDHYHRISVDLSLGFDEKTRKWNNPSGVDLRIKKSGDSEKISVKIGNFAIKSRKEIEVKLVKGGIEKAVEMFMVLGFDKGMIYAWESWEYEYKNYEVKLSRYNENYYVWEIESGENGEDPDVLASELELISFSEADYRKAIDWQNENIHFVFSLEKLKELLMKAEK